MMKKKKKKKKVMVIMMTTMMMMMMTTTTMAFTQTACSHCNSKTCKIKIVTAAQDGRITEQEKEKKKKRKKKKTRNPIPPVHVKRGHTKKRKAEDETDKAEARFVRMRAHTEEMDVD